MPTQDHTPDSSPQPERDPAAERERELADELNAKVEALEEKAASTESGDPTEGATVEINEPPTDEERLPHLCCNVEVEYTAETKDPALEKDERAAWKKRVKAHRRAVRDAEARGNDAPEPLPEVDEERFGMRGYTLVWRGHVPLTTGSGNGRIEVVSEYREVINHLVVMGINHLSVGRPQLREEILGHRVVYFMPFLIPGTMNDGAGVAGGGLHVPGKPQIITPGRS